MWIKLSVCLICGVLFLSCGCGKEKSGDESIAKKTGRKVGENISDFTKGLASIGKVKVEISAELQRLGLQQTIAQKLANNEPGISVYMIASNKVYTMLCAKAFNKDKQEIGRANTKIDFDTNDAKYVKFVFPAEMDSALVTSYEIDVVK